MANLAGFNADNVEPNTPREAIPAGKYEAVIVDSEMKTTKAGTGQYLEMIFEVISGEYVSRRVYARLNLHNPNQTAVNIAQAELSAICRAVNVRTPSDSSDLHNIPLMITVKCKKRNDSDDMTNEISGYEAKAGSVKAAVTTPPAGASTGSPPAKAPWMK